LVAPVAGALAADYVRSWGVWRGPRAGVNWIGIVAWAVGVVVGFLPMIGKVAQLGPWSQTEPAAVLAFGAAFVVYLVLALLGLERPTIEVAAGQAEGAGPPV
ncbi:MAG: purine-cytosine permease-like transporter, partial [Isosphaeraceae bacterium]